MKNIGRVIELEKKQKEDLQRLKLHENGLSNIELINQKIRNIESDISQAREELRERIFKFIFNSIENTPTSISKELRIKEESIYIYRKSDKPSIEKISDYKEEILEKIEDKEDKEKVKKVLELIQKESPSKLDYTFVCSGKNHESLIYDKGEVKVKSKERYRSVVHFDERIVGDLKCMEKLIKYSEEVVYLLEELERKRIEDRIKIRNLYSKVEETFETGDYTKEPYVLPE